MVDKLRHPTTEVNIALVGKYIQLHDAYISVVEALKHGGIDNRAVVNIKWIDSETVTEENADELLCDVTGILVPADSEAVVSTARLPLLNMPVNIRSRSLACALACSCPSWNMQET